MKKSTKKQALIIGAGPAGLTAGIELLKTNKFFVTILEKDSVVGGLAKTTEFKGCRFDIGPHHYITESDKILSWWMAIMSDDFAQKKRFTRIYYKKHFFHYPLKPFNVMQGLSIGECLRCVANYVKVRFFPIKPVMSFQDWVTNKFGYRLFSIFFKTYTEKLWGIPCDKISADWAAQRIKSFDLSKAIFYAFFGWLFTKNKPRTISDAFYYPSRGSGTLWERVADHIVKRQPGSLLVDNEVVGIQHQDNTIIAVLTQSTTDAVVKKLQSHAVDYLFSSMPLRQLILSMDPLPPVDVIEAAKQLRYRGMITVNLVINKMSVCPDHWVYVHEREVLLTRFGNMNNFSECMVDDATKHSALELEYFTFTDGPLWAMSDQELLDLGKRELVQIGLVQDDQILDGMVTRVPDAYPMYDENYQSCLNTVLNYLAQFSNLQLMGRNGMHCYNNMDVAMLSAMEAVDKALEHEVRSSSQTKQNTVDSVFLT